MSSGDGNDDINHNADDVDDFFASLCNWTNNTVVHCDGTIDRRWILFLISYYYYI